jgi:uncharacterized membrane protein/uncharacterized membrane-anchored protein
MVITSASQSGAQFGAHVSAWTLFFKRSFSLAGVVLFLTGLAMFLAWNWPAMPKILKFALFELVFGLCAGLAIWRWRSESRAYWLLGAGISTGLLLALFGQIYQTGANAWELFRLWTLVVLPLFLLTRSVALGLLLWLTGSLWVALYSVGDAFNLELMYYGESFFLRSDSLIYQQVACWVFCELLHQLTLKLNWAVFDPLRWLTRFMGAVSLSVITLKLAVLLTMSGYYNSGHMFDGFLHSNALLIYLAALVIIFIVYYKKKPDLFFISLAVFSVTILLTTMLLRVLFDHLFMGGAETTVLTGGIAVILLFTGAGLLIFKLRKNMLCAYILANSAQVGQDNAHKNMLEQAHIQPWYMKLPMALGIWLGALLTACFVVLLSYDSLGRAGMGCLGFVFSVAGVWLCRKKGFTPRQLGLASIFCGLLLCAAFLVDDVKTGLLFYTLIFLGLWAAMKAPSARIICFAAALIAFLFLFEYVKFSFRTFEDMHETEGAFPLLATAMFTLATAFSLAILGSQRKKISAATPFLASAAGGALLFAMLGAVFVLCLPESPIPTAEKALFYGVPLGILSGAVFLLFNKPGTLAFKITLMLAGIVLAIIGSFSPVSALGLILLLLAKSRADLILMGFAAVYLALGITFYYYNINISFVQKTVAMMVSGSILLVFAAAAGIILSRFLAPGNPQQVTQTGQAILSGALLPRLICILTLAGFLVSYNVSIASKEALLEQGAVMLLKLRPVDPLSLLQGYYMRLDFDAERIIAAHLDVGENEDADSASAGGTFANKPAAQGLAVMRAVGGDEYVFARIYAGGELAPGEQLLAFKIIYANFSSVRIGGGSYFFEEGYEKLYSRASYAEFRVDTDGSSVLKQLRDEDKRVIPILAESLPEKPGD